MREIRMRTVSAGPTGVLHIGEKYTLDEQEAEELVRGGFAEYAVIQNPKPVLPAQEKAVVGPTEVAGKGKVQVEQEKPATGEISQPKAPWGK